VEIETHYDKLNQKLDNIQTECSKRKKHQNHNQQQLAIHPPIPLDKASRAASLFLDA
jgi:hypothetical protein